MWTTNKELGACLIASVHENKCAWSRDKVLPNISTTELNIYTHTKKKKSENNKATKNDESCFQGKTLEHFLHFSSVFYENHLKGVLNITKHSDIQSDLDLISLIENCTFSSDLVLKMLEMNFFLAINETLGHSNLSFRVGTTLLNTGETMKEANVQVNFESVAKNLPFYSISIHA